MRRVKFILSLLVLADQQYVDHERQYLAKELEQSVGSNHRMSLLHSMLLDEKNSLQEENEKLQRIIEDKNQEIEETQLELQNLQSMLYEKIENNEDLKQQFFIAQHLCKDNAEKSQLVIHYQHQIITLKDEKDLLDKEITTLKLRNRNLLDKMNCLKTDYDWQRTRSETLSDQVDKNKNELEELRKEKETNKIIFELQFELARVTEEKDNAVGKMKDFRDVTSALKVKYDRLKQEKYEEAEKRGEV